MKDSARYVKIVEWSDEDQCFVGSCPGLFHGGCHGNDEQAVFAELCEIVEETIELYQSCLMAPSHIGLFGKGPPLGEQMTVDPEPGSVRLWCWLFEKCPPAARNPGPRSILEDQTPRYALKKRFRASQRSHPNAASVSSATRPACRGLLQQAQACHNPPNGIGGLARRRERLFPEKEPRRTEDAIRDRVRGVQNTLVNGNLPARPRCPAEVQLPAAHVPHCPGLGFSHRAFPFPVIYTREFYQIPAGAATMVLAVGPG